MMEKCPKCKGAVLIEAEVDIASDQNIVYTRCVIRGDRDFIELEDVVDGPGPLCPSTCGGRAEGCVPCINISGRFNNGDN